MYKNCSAHFLVYTKNNNVCDVLAKKIKILSKSKEVTVGMSKTKTQLTYYFINSLPVCESFGSFLALLLTGALLS